MAFSNNIAIALNLSILKPGGKSFWLVRVKRISKKPYSFFLAGREKSISMDVFLPLIVMLQQAWLVSSDMITQQLFRMKSALRMI